MYVYRITVRIKYITLHTRSSFAVSFGEREKYRRDLRKKTKKKRFENTKKLLKIFSTYDFELIIRRASCCDLCTKSLPDKQAEL